MNQPAMTGEPMGGKQASMRTAGLWTYRELLRQLVVRDLKARYKVSVLGFFWSLLRPLLTIAVLAAVFSYFQIPRGRYAVDYPFLLMAAYLPWFYFSATFLEGTHSILANGNLVKKVYCPREVFPTAVVGAQLVNFLLALLVLVPVLYLLSDARPGWAILQLPLVIAVHTAFLLGLCLAASVLNVLFRDTTQITEFLAFIWFYLSPVLYGVDLVYSEFGALSLLYMLNPMAGILEWYRYSLLGSALSQSSEFAWLNGWVFWGAIPYSILMSLLALGLGFWLLRTTQSKAVDQL